MVDENQRKIFFSALGELKIKKLNSVLLIPSYIHYTVPVDDIDDDGAAAILE